MIRLEDTEQNLTFQEIFDFEIEFNLKFPESYKSHILKYNGGYPIDELYFKGYPIDEFISIKYGDYHMSERLKNLKGFFDNNISIPIATSNGGVIYIDTEKIYVKYSDGQIDFLANSFKHFLDGIKNEAYDF